MKFVELLKQLCHPERSEESLVICFRQAEPIPEMFRFAQHDTMGVGRVNVSMSS
jgi:hypothetical protein